MIRACISMLALSGCTLIGGGGAAAVAALHNANRDRVDARILSMTPAEIHEVKLECLEWRQPKLDEAGRITDPDTRTKVLNGLPTCTDEELTHGAIDGRRTSVGTAFLIGAAIGLALDIYVIVSLSPCCE